MAAKLGRVRKLTSLQRAVAQIIAKFRVDSIIEMEQHIARFPHGSEFRARGKAYRRCAEELEALVLKTATKKEREHMREIMRRHMKCSGYAKDIWF